MIPLPVVLFLKSNLFKYGMAVLLILGSIYAAYSWAYSRGFDARDKTAIEELAARDKKYNLLKDEYEGYKEAQKKYKAEVDLREKEVLKTLEAKEKETRELRETQRKELSNVRKYITEAADRKCQLSLGTVRLFDSAARPTEQANPRSDPGDVDAPGDVALSELGEVVKDNYLTCNRWRDQLISWQSWYKEWVEWKPSTPAP